MSSARHRKSREKCNTILWIRYWKALKHEKCGIILWPLFITRESLNTRLVFLVYCCRNFYNNIVIKFVSEFYDGGFLYRWDNITLKFSVATIYSSHFVSEFGTTFVCMLIGQGTKPVLLASAIEPWSIATFVMHVVTNSDILRVQPTRCDVSQWFLNSWFRAS